MALADIPAPSGILHPPPVIGLAADGRGPVFLLIAGLLALLAAATALWGLPVLAMAALAMVPVVFAVLILITLG